MKINLFFPGGVPGSEEGKLSKILDLRKK